MLDCYYTVKGYGDCEIVIQKSRFIAYVNRAETEEEAQAFIAEIKKKHWDATHNCSAYLIGENDQIQKANDDGEPAGTAGIPMLEVLKKRQLKDTVVVVTRYFGGIKLGAGGLIRAYGKSAALGIDAVGVVKRQLMQTFTITVDYSWLGKLENELRQSRFILDRIDYEHHVHIHVQTAVHDQDAFTSWITDLTNGQCTIKTGDVVYREELVTTND